MLTLPQLEHHLFTVNLAESPSSHNPHAKNGIDQFILAGLIFSRHLSARVPY